MKNLARVMCLLGILIPLNAFSQSHAVLPSTSCGTSETLRAKIHLAIYEALKYPANTAFYAATGITSIKYDYLNGEVSNVRMTESSGNGILDRAALRAVKNAQYPPAPDTLRNTEISDIVYFVFDNSDLGSRNNRANDSGDALRRQLSMDSKCASQKQ